MYVATYLDKQHNVLKVSERINGQRVETDYPLILEYYIEDENGYYDATNGKKLKRMTYSSALQTNSLLKQYKESGIKTYELGFNLTNKVLYKYYKDSKAPELHKSFFDIEVDRYGLEHLTIKEMVDKACCPINAVSIYNNWQDTLFTLMLCPENIPFEEAQKICQGFENTVLFKEEKDLLNGIILLLQDSDALVGYNSNFFDIPYIIRRIENVLGKGESKRINLWDIEPYMKEKTNQFGDKNITYELYGKISVDYLELYKKHERGKKDSYKLDNIAEIELGEKKVQHDESLDDMYRQRYEDFIKYNRQDTLLVKKLDDKLKYINIHNRQCHGICCTYESTMGTVAWVDQAIINSCHEVGQYVQDSDETKGQEFNGIIPPGAYVPTPIPGLHNNIMSFDMASLYPNTCIALNMSSESIVGQVRLTLTKPYLYEKIESNNLYKNKGEKLPDWGAAWANEWGTLEYREIMSKTDTPLILDVEGGGSVQKTAKELYDIIFSDGSNLNISAFGTIFRTDKEGRVSYVFKQWYAQRKKYKKKMGHYEDLESGVKVDSTELINSIAKNLSSYGNTIGDIKEYDVKLLKELIEKTNVDELCQYMKENDLELSDDGRIISKHIKYFQEQAEYWDVEQYLEKIKLNSSYGTLLNTSSTFYDFRFGSSITMTGRLVWKHLASKTNELISGEYKYDGSAIRTGDTDSCYASIDSDDFRRLYPNFDYSKENIIEFSNKVGKDVNDSFPQYMIDTFHCTPEGAAREGAAREVVASRALVCGKKRYAMMVYEKDGYRQDINGKPGKAKIMGIQVARSDTHPLVKELLKKMLNSVLTDGSKEKLVEIMRNFGNKDWGKLNAWDKGTPRTVNKLDFYTKEYNKSGKCSVGQVMASINWNRMLEMMGDKKSPKILDGDKVIVCKMKPNNPFGYKSIALPNTITRVPKWFKQLPFDEQSMVDSVVDKTIETVFGVIGWNLALKDAMESSNEDLESILTFC